MIKCDRGNYQTPLERYLPAHDHYRITNLDESNRRHDDMLFIEHPFSKQVERLDSTEHVFNIFLYRPFLIYLEHFSGDICHNMLVSCSWLNGTPGLIDAMLYHHAESAINCLQGSGSSERYCWHLVNETGPYIQCDYGSINIKSENNQRESNKPFIYITNKIPGDPDFYDFDQLYITHSGKHARIMQKENREFWINHYFPVVLNVINFKGIVRGFRAK